MKIGVDLDEVLADLFEKLLPYHDQVYGTSLRREDFKSFQLWRTWGGTPAEDMGKLLGFYETSAFREIRPIEGSQEAILRLRKRHELFVITGQHDPAAEETRKWLERYFPGAFSEVHFTNYGHNGKVDGKAVVCDKLRVGAMIDDSLEYATECVRPHRPVLLFDRPWNQAELPDGVVRVYSWDEITKSLL